MLEAIHRWESEGGAVAPGEPDEARLATAHAAGAAKDEDRLSTLPLRCRGGVVTREADRDLFPPDSGPPRAARDLRCRE